MQCSTGFELTLTVPEAIKELGHSDSHIQTIMQNGEMKATESLAADHAVTPSSSQFEPLAL